MQESHDLQRHNGCVCRNPHAHLWPCACSCLASCTWNCWIGPATHTHDVQAYALSEELNKWLLFDDTNIKYIGSWREVAASMREGRHQPSLLFYERI